MPQLPLRLLLPTTRTGTLLHRLCAGFARHRRRLLPLAVTPASASTTRPTGTPADSLNRMPGHPLGELRSRFTHLMPVETKLADGGRRSQRPPGKQRGWFGKHQPAVSATYQFQNGRFTAFQANVQGENQAVLREQARDLLGPGHPILNEGQGPGKRVGVSFPVRGFGPDQFSQLQVWRKPLLDQQAAAKARRQAENAPVTR